MKKEAKKGQFKPLTKLDQKTAEIFNGETKTMFPDLPKIEPKTRQIRLF